MEIIVIKILLCSTIFILLYYAFLEKEKMFVFNRFFLLVSLFVSYIVPFISLTIPAIQQEKSQLVFEEALQNIIISPAKETTIISWENALWIVYFGMTIFLIIRNLTTIIRILNIKGKLIKFNNQKIKILNKNIPPFSFLNTIYIGKKYFENNEIDERIFLHEKTHITQKHSWDLILVELLKVLTWFNPALYFYKKVMVTNHEFLADESVLSKKFDLRSYQNLILNEITDYQTLNFTHSFNFNNTKNRFIMMNKQNSKFLGLKKILSVPILIFVLLLFAEKTFATKKENKNVTVKPTIKNEDVATPIDPNNMTDEEKVMFEKMMNEEPDYIIDLRQNKQDTIRQKNDQIPAPPPPMQDFVQAEFPGGIINLRSQIAQSFDTSVFSGNEGTMKAVAYISINSEGNVASVVVEGENEIFNKETQKTVEKIAKSQQWKPATSEGKPVQTVIQTPLTMTFEK